MTSYLRKFPDHNSRLMRWSLKMSELGFVVQHIPGSNKGHVDTLSSHVGAVIHEDSPKNAFFVNNRMSSDSGVMYRRHPGDKHQIVVLRTLIYVIKENHNPVYVAHPAIKRTHVLL